VSLAVSWRSSVRPFYISDRHMPHRCRTVEMRLMNGKQQDRRTLILNDSVTCRNNLTTVYVITRR